VSELADVSAPPGSDAAHPGHAAIALDTREVTVVSSDRTLVRDGYERFADRPTHRDALNNASFGLTERTDSIEERAHAVS
jgi:hypothetical protein